MTEVEVTTLLAELSKTAKALNKESDSLNEVIEQLEERLNEMNVGLEVWLTSEIASTKDEENTGETDHGTGEDVVRKVTYDTQLGYAKVGDSWHLAVQEMKYAYDYDERGNQEWQAVGITESPSRLRDASRKIRLTALTAFPLLLKAIHREAQAALEGVQRAKKFAK